MRNLMYWRIGKFRELEHLEPDERQQVLACVSWSTYPHMILLALFSGVIIAGIFAWLGDFFGGVMAAIAAIVGMVGGTVLSYQGQIGGIRRSMRLTIAKAYDGHRLPFCLFCGYDLRAASTDQCPECGKGVVPNFPPMKR